MECPLCKGLGRYLLVNDQHPTGVDRPCPRCADLLKHSRLNERERRSLLSDIQGEGSALVLRVAGAKLLKDPFGWFVTWGGTGSAKTLFLQALVVAYCKRGIQATYYHAVDLQDGILRDVNDPDSANMEFYRRIPVLAIDELDKYYFKDWSQKQLQALLDFRYRQMDKLVTLIASNRDPFDTNRDGEPWLPADILSRMQDGRFYITWPLGLDAPAGITDAIPGVYHVESFDMRPFLRRDKQAAG